MRAKRTKLIGETAREKRSARKEARQRCAAEAKRLRSWVPAERKRVQGVIASMRAALLQQIANLKAQTAEIIKLERDELGKRIKAARARARIGECVDMEAGPIVRRFGPRLSTELAAARKAKPRLKIPRGMFTATDPGALVNHVSKGADLVLAGGHAPARTLSEGRDNALIAHEQLITTDWERLFSQSEAKLASQLSLASPIAVRGAREFYERHKPVRAATPRSKTKKRKRTAKVARKRSAMGAGFAERMAKARAAASRKRGARSSAPAALAKGREAAAYKEREAGYLSVAPSRRNTTHAALTDAQIRRAFLQGWRGMWGADPSWGRGSSELDEYRDAYDAGNAAGLSWDAPNIPTTDAAYLAKTRQRSADAFAKRSRAPAKRRATKSRVPGAGSRQQYAGEPPKAPTMKGSPAVNGAIKLLSLRSDGAKGVGNRFHVYFVANGDENIVGRRKSRAGAEQLAGHLAFKHRQPSIHGWFTQPPSGGGRASVRTSAYKLAEPHFRIEETI